MDKKQLAQYIDHSLLSPTVIESQIRTHCQEAIQYGFCSVCIEPRWVDLGAELLRGSGVKVCTVAGFPLGTNVARVKAYDADLAIASGADEIDMVADLASIISGDEKYLLNDIRTVLKVCRSVRPFVTLKVIIESAALTDEQIVFASRIIEQTGADFIKTSTGMHAAGGARLEHVRLIAQTAPKCKVKAAGGVRTTADALAMIQAGANRLGATKSIEIINGLSAM